MSDQIRETLDYRGYHIVFYDDDPGQQVYTIWEGEEIGFGSFNLNYIDDMKHMIDDKLDTIYTFDDDRTLWGAKLI